MSDLMWSSSAPTRPGYYWFKNMWGKAKVVHVQKDTLELYIVDDHTFHKLYVAKLVKDGNYFSNAIPYPKTQPPKEVKQPRKEVAH